MPNGLKFQRKHRFWGYKLKYLYYCIARRDVLQKKKSFGEYNENKIIYLIKPDYQDGVEGLLSLIHKQVIYIDYAKQKGYRDASRFNVIRILYSCFANKK